MNDSYKPSKQFLIRGSIATAIVAIVLIAQTDWFHSIFKKDKHTAPTIGELIMRDSNSNEIPDWEEKLWGLDPTVLYTNGVSNRTIIEEKKRALGINIITEPINETDALARQLLTITTALGQSDQVSKNDLGDIATKLADSVEFKEFSNKYSINQLDAVETSSASLQRYYDSMAMLATKHSKQRAGIDLLIESIEREDISRVTELADAKTAYDAYAEDLSQVQVPIGVQKLHLDITNATYGMAISLGYLAQLTDNSVNALAGIALYKVYDQKLTNALLQMEEYLSRYGILEVSS